MPVTIGDIYQIVNEMAPFSLQEEWDNADILAGSASWSVERVLCALDLNFAVLKEAKEKNVQLIVTHHPILFRGRKNLREDDVEGRLLCELIRSRIALIAAHTNYDSAQPGVNDALAKALGLTDVLALEGGVRMGTAGERTLGAFRARAEASLGGVVRMYGEKEREICRVAVLGGAGGDYYPIAKAAGADVFLTGEIAHHKAWDAYQDGMCILEAGHAATELPAISTLADGLQNAANGVKWNLKVFESQAELFR